MARQHGRSVQVHCARLRRSLGLPHRGAHASSLSGRPSDGRSSADVSPRARARSAQLPPRVLDAGSPEGRRSMRWPAHAARHLGDGVRAAPSPCPRSSARRTPHAAPRRRRTHRSTQRACTSRRMPRRTSSGFGRGRAGRDARPRHRTGGDRRQVRLASRRPRGLGRAAQRGDGPEAASGRAHRLRVHARRPPRRSTPRAARPTFGRPCRRFRVDHAAAVAAAYGDLTGVPLGTWPSPRPASSAVSTTACRSARASPLPRS